MADERKKYTWNWQKRYSQKALQEAKKLLEETGFVTWKEDPDGRGGKGKIRWSMVKAAGLPVKASDLAAENFESAVSLSCDSCYYGSHCEHEAAFLMNWERLHGEFSFLETGKEAEARVMKERLKGKTMPLSELMQPPLRKDVFYRGLAQLEEASAPRYQGYLAGPYLEPGAAVLKVREEFTREGEPALHAVFLSPDGHKARIRVGRKKVYQYGCTCPKGLPLSERPAGEAELCWHELVVIARTWAYIGEYDPGDETDRNAAALLKLLSAREEKDPGADAFFDGEAGQGKTVRIEPELVLEDGGVFLSFRMDIGSGKKPYVMKNLDKIAEAVQKREVFAFSRFAAVDFGQAEIDEEGKRWLSFIEAARQGSDRRKDFTHSRAGQSSYEAKPKSLLSPVDLSAGQLFDSFYDMALGRTIPVKNQNPLKVEHVTPAVDLTAEPLFDQGVFKGARLVGKMPPRYESGIHTYVFSGGSLSRCSKEDLELIRPFSMLAGPDGKIEGVIGVKQFPAFYTKLLPELAAAPSLHLTDKCRGKVESLLPPEPEFSFYLDRRDGEFRCRVEAAYGEVRFFLPGSPEEKILRDGGAEEEIAARVKKVFPVCDGTGFSLEDTQENLYGLLAEGLPSLREAGTVLASSSVAGLRLTHLPKFVLSLGMPLSSDLLDLQLLSPHMDEEELLAVFRSYEAKKSCYRLKSGDLLDLAHDRALGDLESFAAALGCTAEDLLAGKVHVPRYRALYVNSLLEEHEQIAANGDRGYRRLIKSFKTVPYSDFEVPPDMEEVLRPYQLYGHQWLRTLIASRFGGILADEMGLGKTLQVLTVLACMAGEGESGPFLVICPASLVYHWKEEAARSVPDLTVKTLAGSLPERRRLLSELREGKGDGVLYVTSYDLCRRDLALYQDVSFEVIVLDEAQCIKNAKSGISKAVKTLKGARRLALTGTPIENRLLELWSIFDFLMPGFLYSQTEFGRRFETPMAKYGDEEAGKALAALTGPFILRRLKKDVLRDLPERLEEVRFTRLQGRQRELYDAQAVHVRRLLEGAGDLPEERRKILSEITKLRQICCDPSLVFEKYDGPSAKREAFLELAASAMDGGHRMLVFSRFTGMLSLAEKDLKEAKIPCFLLTGSAPREERLRLAGEFNGGDVPVFLLSLKSGGTGLNLTGADMAVHLDPCWDVSAQNRTGQTRPVQVFKLIAAGTIEEKIRKMQERRQDLADAILGCESGSLLSMTREVLLELLS